MSNYSELGQLAEKLLPRIDLSTRSELLRAGVIPADVGASLAATIQTIAQIEDDRARHRRVCEG